MDLSMILPCKISIYEDKGKTCISMLKISKLIPLLDSTLENKAKEIEDILLKIIEVSK